MHRHQLISKLGLPNISNLMFSRFLKVCNNTNTNKKKSKFSYLKSWTETFPTWSLRWNLYNTRMRSRTPTTTKEMSRT